MSNSLFIPTVSDAARLGCSLVQVPLTEKMHGQAQWSMVSPHFFPIDNHVRITEGTTTKSG